MNDWLKSRLTLGTPGFAFFHLRFYSNFIRLKSYYSFKFFSWYFYIKLVIRIGLNVTVRHSDSKVLCRTLAERRYEAIAVRIYSEGNETYTKPLNLSQFILYFFPHSKKMIQGNVCLYRSFYYPKLTLFRNTFFEKMYLKKYAISKSMAYNLMFKQ